MPRATQPTPRQRVMDRLNLNRRLFDHEKEPQSWLGKRAVRVARVLYLVFSRFRHDHLFQRASALSFATIISLIPLTVLFFSFAGLLGGGDTIIAYVREKIFPLVAPDFQQQLNEWLDEHISTTAFRAGPTGVVNVAAVVGLLLAAFGMMATAERYMNAIWHSEAKRTYLQKLVSFWVILTVSPFLILVSMYVSEILVPRGGMVDQLIGKHWILSALYGFVVPVLIGFLGFSTVYQLLPATRVRIASAALGGLVAALLWELCRRGFFLYVARAKEITSFYPKLASVPLFLIWIYLNWLIVLFGAEIGYVHQNLGALLRRRAHSAADLGFSRVYVALGVLHCLAQAFGRGERAPKLAEIAHTIGVPLESVEAITPKLAEHELIVEDARRPGAYALAIAPGKIGLRDVAATMLEAQFPVEANTAISDKSRPEHERVIADAWRAFLDRFEGKTLADPAT